MAQITTASITDVVGYPSVAPIALGWESPTRYLYSIVQTAAGTLTVYRSTNSGGSWASLGSFTQTSLAEWSSLVIDKNGYGHIAYRISTTGGGGTDTIWYRRFSTSSGTFSSGLQVSLSDSNGGTAGATWQGVDLAVVRHSNGSYAIAVVGARTIPGVQYGVQVMGVSITADGTIYKNNGIITGNRNFLDSGTAPGRSGVSCDIEHTGDGFTSATPNLWVAWGRTTVKVAKLAWKGTYVGWQGPSSFTTLKAGLSAQDYQPARWDGSRWITAAINPDDTTTVAVYQRNQANSGTTTITTPTHPTGVIRQIALSYDATDKDLRVYAVGTSTTVLYFVDYDRGIGAWGSWATVSATAVLGTGGVEFGVRRGGTSNNARHDVVTAHSGAPNTIVHTAQTAASAPYVATINTSTQPYTNGGAADVAASLTIDWDFLDPDAGDTQGSYAVSRQIGAGSLAYWRASDSTWQASQVQNSSATTQLTLSSGWGLDADADHTYRVMVWDSAGNPAPGYSQPLIIKPSAKVNPTITSPTSGGTINTDTVTVTWTAAQQKQRRVRLLIGGVQVFSTGFEASSDLSYTVPYRMDNGTAATIEVTTTNSEGLASTAASHNFTVTYAAPPAPVPALVAMSVTSAEVGPHIQVTGSANAAAGAQPSITGLTAYRRRAVTPNLATNSSMDGNVTGWGHGGGGTSSTITYSTVQFAPGSSPGSARVVPAGTVAAPVLIQNVANAVAVNANALYVASAWIRPDTANKPITVSLAWYNSSNALLSSTTTTLSSPVAGAWHFLRVIEKAGDRPSTAAKVVVSAGESSTPAATDAFYVDELQLRVYNAEAGVPFASGVAVGEVLQDWGAEGATELEYALMATGSNGASILGPWTS